MSNTYSTPKWRTRSPRSKRRKPRVKPTDIWKHANGLSAGLQLLTTDCLPQNTAPICEGRVAVKACPQLGFSIRSAGSSWTYVIRGGYTPSVFAGDVAHVMRVSYAQRTGICRGADTDVTAIKRTGSHPAENGLTGMQTAVRTM